MIGWGLGLLAQTPPGVPGAGGTGSGLPIAPPAAAQVLPNTPPAAPVPAQSSPPPAAESAVPSARDVLGTLPSNDAGAGDTPADRELLALRQAYKGPFILASDLFGQRGFGRIPGASVSDDYRLGPGDEMLLYVFGSATFEVPLVVDRTGRVTIPKVGSAKVEGLRLGDARQVIQRLVGSLFAGSRVDLQFAKTRDVRIFILGEVYRPGSYVVPSLTSLVNALNLAGGPSPVGTHRSIRLIREGRVLQELDLYALRLQGQGLDTVLLRDGDTLFVPLTGVQVLMEGAFVRVATSPQSKEAPGVLVELKPGETAADALAHIGGLTPSAYPTLITLQRKDPAGVLHVENLALDPKLLAATHLYPGDRLKALLQAERSEGLVEVAGYARVPGTFAYRSGMRLSDLLLEPSQIQPNTYMGRVQVLRTLDDGRTVLLSAHLGRALQRVPEDDLLLQPRDRVELYRVEDLRLKATVTILGPFTRPGTYDWHEGMRASDLIFLAGIPRLEADRSYAELARQMPDGTYSEVVKLDLQRLLHTDQAVPGGLADPAINPMLRPYDQITLYARPDFKVHRTVIINGQVQRPGPYVIREPRFTLRQLIERAGGLTPEAMPKGGIFLRRSLKERGIEGQDLQKIGLTSADPTGQGINEILKRLSETKRVKETGALLQSPVLHGLLEGNINRLVVDFEAALKGDARQDVELLDGDEIIIPRHSESAYVVGEVASPFSVFRVKSGDTVKELIDLAGGFTRNADRLNVRLLKADGRILDSWVLWRKVEPGDAVLVPQRFRVHTTWQDNLQALTPLALILNAIQR